jgi:hypothetical protein
MEPAKEAMTPIQDPAEAAKVAGEPDSNTPAGYPASGDGK